MEVWRAWYVLENFREVFTYYIMFCIFFVFDWFRLLLIFRLKIDNSKINNKYIECFDLILGND